MHTASMYIHWWIQYNYVHVIFKFLYRFVLVAPIIALQTCEQAVGCSALKLNFVAKNIRRFVDEVHHVEFFVVC